MENAEAAGFLSSRRDFSNQKPTELINNSGADVLTIARHTQNTDNFSILIFHSTLSRSHRIQSSLKSESSEDLKSKELTHLRPRVVQDEWRHSARRPIVCDP